MKIIKAEKGEKELSGRQAAIILNRVVREGLMGRESFE